MSLKLYPVKGFTSINNDILENLLRWEISPTALKCAFFVLRKTKGFNKNIDKIAYSQFSKAIGRDVRNIIKGMKELQLLNIIFLVNENKNVGSINEWKFNEDTSTWKINVSKTSVVTKKSSTSDKNAKIIVIKTPHTKRNITKENNIIKNGEVLSHKLASLPLVQSHDKEEVDNFLNPQFFQEVSIICQKYGIKFECKEKAVWEQFVNRYTCEDIVTAIHKACSWMLDKTHQKVLRISTLQSFLKNIPQIVPKEKRNSKYYDDEFKRLGLSEFMEMYRSDFKNAKEMDKVLNSFI